MQQTKLAVFSGTLPKLLLLVNLAADHLERRLPVHHGVSSKQLAAVGALQLPVGEVFNDALLVAFHQRPLPSFFVPVRATIFKNQT